MSDDRIYTEDERAEIMRKVIDGLALGTPLAEMCREDDMPDRVTIYRWKDEDSSFAQHFARAREAGFDEIAEGTLKIIDNITEDPASRRVRMDGRLKLLAKWDPKRYGDKIDVTSDNKALPASSVAVFALPDNGRS